MKHGDIVLIFVFRVRYGGLAGTGEAEYGENILPAAAVLQLIAFQSAVAGGIAVARGGAPGKRQRSLLELSEITHPKDRGAVLFRREEGETKRIVGMSPVRVGVNEEVAVVRQLAGILVALRVLVVKILEIKHPAVKVVLKSLRHHNVGLDHEVLLKADDRLGRIEPAEAGVMDGFAQQRREVGHGYSRMPHYPARRGAAPEYRAVVEKQHVRILGKAKLRRPVDRHACQFHSSGTVLRKPVGLPEIFDRGDIVAVKGRLDSRPDGCGVEPLETLHIHKMPLRSHGFSSRIKENCN